MQKLTFVFDLLDLILGPEKPGVGLEFRAGVEWELVEDGSPRCLSCLKMAQDRLKMVQQGRRCPKDGPQIPLDGQVLCLR